MRFDKMEGVGNHFVVLDAAAIPAGQCLSELAIRLCAERVGVGGDGLLLGSVDPENAVPVRMRMFNPDGTEDMCGNGLRCIALWALRHDAARVGEPFSIRTKEGVRSALITQAGKERRTAHITVDMGVPKFRAGEIPFADHPESTVIRRTIEAGGREFTITALNTGSTHTVIFGEPPTEEEFQRYSPLLELHPLFPERTTVLWATPLTPTRVAVRIWERGVGETFGCGTGACAVGVAARLAGIATGDTPIEVVSRGGTLTIDWPGSDSSIAMTGPANIIYTGEIAID